MRLVSQKWNLCLCEIPEGSLTSFSTGGHSEKMVICELGSLSPPNTKSGFLIMDSPASKTVRHEYLSFEQPSLGYSCQSSQALLPLLFLKATLQDKHYLKAQARKSEVTCLTSCSCLVALVERAEGAPASLPAPQRRLTTGMHALNLYLNVYI